MKNPKQLYLVLKKQYFDEILAGTKKEEYRGFTDHFINRLCEVDEDGQILDTKKYETVKVSDGLQQRCSTNDSRVQTDPDRHR